MPQAAEGGGRPILAATDLSARADRALRRAALIAATLGAELVVLHVVDEEQPRSLVELERREAARLLAAQLEGLPELAALRSRPMIETGDPFRAILAAAEREGARCVVLGEHRRGGVRDLFAGTTVERVLRWARRPVLMVRRPPAGPYRRVVLATDFSALAEEAARVADALGLLGSAELMAVHALVPPRLGALAEAGMSEGAREGLGAAVRAEAEAALLRHAARLRRPARPLLREGAAAEVVEEVIAELDAELLLLGTRAAGPLRQALLGSVAAELMAGARADVLAVPPA